MVGVDPYLDETVRLASGAKVSKSFAECMETQERGFDLITLNHVYEHVDDPRSVARQLCEVLAPDGVMVIRIPSIKSPHFKQYRGDWWNLHAPRHLFLYSQEAIELLFAEHGLEIIHTKCDSQADHYLYSQEYFVGITDASPLSIRNGGRGIFTGKEIEYWKEKAQSLNAALLGDWIVYYLARPGAAKATTVG